jgi:hypothetical protein
MRLDFNELRRNAAEAEDARKAALSLKRSLRERIYSAVFECSLDGAVALATMAHLSLVSEGMPAEVPLAPIAIFMGSSNATCRRQVDGTWTGHASAGKSIGHLAPGMTVPAVAEAAHIPLGERERHAIFAVSNPLAERDFTHFGKVLDLLPSRTLWSMLGHGPTLARSFGIAPQDHHDIGRFAASIGDAIARREGEIQEPGRHVLAVIDECIGEGRGEFERPTDIRIMSPVCVEMFDPHVPPKAIEAFLEQAVRVGFDINDMAEYHGASAGSVAHEAVRMMDVRGLVRLEALGLSLERSVRNRNLCDGVLSRLRMVNQPDTALSVLKHLVLDRGFVVEREAHELLRDRAGHLHDRIVSGRGRASDAMHQEIVVEAIEFIESHFPGLRRPARRKKAVAV